MPEMPHFMETMDKLKELHRKKNADYANDENPFFNFDNTAEILALFSDPRDQVFVWPIANKLTRLANLLSGNREPNNESIEDSLDDIIVYTTMWKCDIIRRKKIPYHNQEASEESNRLWIGPDPRD